MRLLRKLLVCSFAAAVQAGNLVLQGSSSGIVVSDPEHGVSKLEFFQIKDLSRIPTSGWEIRGRPSGTYLIDTGAGWENLYVDNDYGSGGWVIVAKVGGCEKDLTTILSTTATLKGPGFKAGYDYTDLTNDYRDYTAFLKLSRESMNGLFMNGKYNQIRYDYNWVGQSWTNPFNNKRYNHYHTSWTTGNYGANSKNYVCQKNTPDPNNKYYFDAFLGLYDARIWSNFEVENGSYIAGPGSQYHVYVGNTGPSGTLTSSSAIPHHNGGYWDVASKTFNNKRSDAFTTNISRHGGMCWGDIERGAQWMYTLNNGAVNGCELQHTNVYIR